MSDSAGASGPEQGASLNGAAGGDAAAPDDDAGRGPDLPLEEARGAAEDSGGDDD